jgi:hypothetical protein
MATLNQLVGQLQHGRLRPAFTLQNPNGGGGVDTGGGGGDGFGSGFPILGPGGGDGGPVLGGGGSGGGGGPSIGVTLPGGGGGTSTTTTPTATSVSFLDSFLNYFTGSGCGIGDFLLRIAFFFLGFIAIVGAIYLYKGSNTILQIPARLTRGAVRAGKMALETGAEA